MSVRAISFGLAAALAGAESLATEKQAYLYSFGGKDEQQQPRTDGGPASPT